MLNPDFMKPEKYKMGRSECYVVTAEIEQNFVGLLHYGRYPNGTIKITLTYQSEQECDYDGDYMDQVVDKLLSDLLRNHTVSYYGGILISNVYVSKAKPVSFDISFNISAYIVTSQLMKIVKGLTQDISALMDISDYTLYPDPELLSIY